MVYLSKIYTKSGDAGDTGLGDGSRVVLTHDVAQRDNLRVGRHDGIASVIAALRGHPIFAHVTFTRSERSAVAALVTSLLDDPRA